MVIKNEKKMNLKILDILDIHKLFDITLFEE